MKKVNTMSAFCREIKELTGLKDVYPSTFPATAKDTCIVVSFVGGAPSKDTVKYALMQVATRSEHPEKAYDLNQEVTQYFKSLRDVKLLSDELLIQCRETQPYPYYLGEDENRRHTYSNNFSLVLSDL